MLSSVCRKCMSSVFEYGSACFQRVYVVELAYVVCFKFVLFEVVFIFTLEFQFSNHWQFIMPHGLR